MAKTRKSARYPGKIQMVSITIRNCPPDQMRQKVNDLPFLGYHVETLADGRRVCITKPGGKSPFGRMKVDDFMVWVYDERAEERWRISHEEIKQDLALKVASDRKTASKFVGMMRKVCEGAEPSDLGPKLQQFDGLPGLPAELILKVCKWIWTQEDCNYPSGQGRWMSMDGITKLLEDEADS